MMSSTQAMIPETSPPPPVPQALDGRLNLHDVVSRLPTSWERIRRAVQSASDRNDQVPSVTSLRKMATTGVWPLMLPEARIQELKVLITKALALAGLQPDEATTLFDVASRPAFDPYYTQFPTTPAERADRHVALRYEPPIRKPVVRPEKFLRMPDHDPASIGRPPVNPPDQDPTPKPAEEETMLMAKQTLSPAARKAFTLFTNPFDGEVISDDMMFTNGEVAYVRETCMQAARGGRFVAIVGESGAGKTTVLSDMEARVLRDKMPVIIIKPWVLGMEESDNKGKTLKSTDILASIVTTLDPLVQPRQTLQGRSNQARDLLMKSAEAGYDHMLVIEEAHSMPEATLKHLKRLHEMRLGRKPLLGILLLGQTELGMKLDPRRANLREVTQRCEVVQLMPLDGDLRAYLEHRAKAANRALGDFIDDSGVNEIRTRLTVTRPSGPGRTSATSLLYPLAVNNLMTASLNLAAELGAGVVTRDVVRSV